MGLGIGVVGVDTEIRCAVPIATPEIYADMLDRAKAGSFAYPAINITSSQTVTAAIRGFAEAGSDGIIQVSTGGAEYASGSTIKNMVAGSLALAAYAEEVAKNYPVNIALHTDHCPKDKLDGFVRPLIAASEPSASRRRPADLPVHMWDGSAVPLDENLQIAQELLALRRRSTSSSRSRSASSVARRTVSPTRSTTSSTRPPRTP
jgi:fructose-bisphosphate aldolase class II